MGTAWHRVPPLRTGFDRLSAGKVRAYPPRGASPRHRRRLWAGGKLLPYGLLCGVALVVHVEAQGISGTEVLGKALALREGIEDYVVEVTTHFELEQAHIPDKTATVYFKQPDKLKVDSPPGIFILPKEAFLLSRLTEAIEENARILLAGTKQTPQGRVYSLKIIPREEGATGRLLVWVNGWNWTVRRMEVWDGLRLALTINWTHQLVQGKYWMPAKVTCELGKGLQRRGRPLRGKATFALRNYRVNTGLKDSFFQRQ